MDTLKEKLAGMALTPEVAAALLADRCRREPQLTSRLRDNPRDCLEELSGRKLPETFKVIVHDNSDDTWHLPLPSHHQAELTEEQLQQISAGEFVVGGVVSAWILGTFVIAAGVGLGVGFGTGEFKT